MRIDGIVYDTVAIGANIREGAFNIYWQGDDGAEVKFICTVQGKSNAVHVARGIAYEQAEYVLF